VRAVLLASGLIGTRGLLVPISYPFHSSNPDEVPLRVRPVRDLTGVHLVPDAWWQVLMPTAVLAVGLVGDLQQRVARWRRGRARRLPVGSAGDLPPTVEVAADRIASEALTNVVRDAHARRCDIGRPVDDLLLIVRDDGIGLARERSAGVILASMRQRVAEVGGLVEVRPGPGGGTVVRARLPVSPG
jgi:signal transduction histidine kinase